MRWEPNGRFTGPRSGASAFNRTWVGQSAPTPFRTTSLCALLLCAALAAHLYRNRAAGGNKTIFPQAGAVIRLHTRVRTKEVARGILERAAREGALFVFTVVSPELRQIGRAHV